MIIASLPPWLKIVEILRHNHEPFRESPNSRFFNFDELEEAIVSEWSTRTGLAADGRVTDDGLAVGVWLRMTTYRAITVCLANDAGEALFERLEVSRRMKRGEVPPEEADGVFRRALAALFIRGNRVLEKDDLIRWAERMWHAYRHYIPPPLLEGFSSQCPAARRKPLGWKALIEPPFEDWVVQQRVQWRRWQDEDLIAEDIFRGEYPESIERRIAGELAGPARRSDWD